MGFTKFCAALLNQPDAELQAIPQTMLEQVPCSFRPTFPLCPGESQGCPPTLGRAPAWQPRCHTTGLVRPVPSLQSSCRLQPAGFQPYLRWVLFLRA